MYDLQCYLDDLESRIDEKQEEIIWDDWKIFADGKSVTAPFVATARTPVPPKIVWPNITINQAINDNTLMLISQFKNCSDMLNSHSANVMSVRANYGVGIIPSMFGAEPFVMSEEANTLPNVRNVSRTRLQQIIDSPLPSFENGFGNKVLSMGNAFSEIRKKYPKIARWIRVDHPDAQGPMDICELLWGSELFLDLYDEPELVHALLKKITEFYKEFLDEWFRIVPPVDGYHTYFGRIHKGTIMVRSDSAMNMAPDFYKEFILPYDSNVLTHFRGGAIHFCGRGEHFIELLSTTPYLYAVDQSQPQLNNMDLILSNTIDKGINLFSNKNTFLPEDMKDHNIKLLSL